jgi:hypothetical protein
MDYLLEPVAYRVPDTRDKSTKVQSSDSVNSEDVPEDCPGRSGLISTQLRSAFNEFGW